MNTQQASLFEAHLPEVGRARRNDPETSKKAAAKVAVIPLGMRIQLALRMHANWGGLTTHELSRCLHVDLVSISPRMRPLVEKGIVKESGLHRRGDNGRISIVWKLA